MSNSYVKQKVPSFMIYVFCFSNAYSYATKYEHNKLHICRIVGLCLIWFDSSALSECGFEEFSLWSIVFYVNRTVNFNLVCALSCTMILCMDRDSNWRLNDEFLLKICVHEMNFSCLFWLWKYMKLLVAYWGHAYFFSLVSTRKKIIGKLRLW